MSGCGEPRKRYLPRYRALWTFFQKLIVSTMLNAKLPTPIHARPTPSIALGRSITFVCLCFPQSPAPPPECPFYTALAWLPYIHGPLAALTPPLSMHLSAFPPSIRYSTVQRGSYHYSCRSQAPAPPDDPSLPVRCRSWYPSL